MSDSRKPLGLLEPTPSESELANIPKTDAPCSQGRLFDIDPISSPHSTPDWLVPQGATKTATMSRPLEFPTSTTANIFGAFLNSANIDPNDDGSKDDDPPEKAPFGSKESTTGRTFSAGIPAMNPFALPAQFTPPAATSQSRLTSRQFTFNSSPGKSFGNKFEVSAVVPQNSDDHAASKSPQTTDTQPMGSSSEVANEPGMTKRSCADAVKSRSTHIAFPGRVIKIARSPKRPGPRASASDSNPQVEDGVPPFLFTAAGVNASTKTPPMSSYTSHNVSDEEPPSDYFYSARFQGELKTSKALMSSVRDILGSSSSHLDESSPVFHLYRRARQLSKIEHRVSRTVGFVGDTCAGRASVLNSLLDLKKLAFDTGTSTCKRVITEYIYHDRQDYEIHVDAFPEDEVQSQVVRWIRAYRLYHLHKSEMDSKDDRYPEEQATEAAHNLRAMFRGQMGAMNFILDQAEHKIVATMMGWWRTIVDMKEFLNGKYVITTLEELSSTVKRLSFKYPQYAGPAQWLYIKRIRVFLKSVILSHELTLVEIPSFCGLLDPTRQKIAERCLLESCDDVFLVSDGNVHEASVTLVELNELSKQPGIADIGVICTGPDLNEHLAESNDSMNLKHLNLSDGANIEKQFKDLRSARTKAAQLEERTKELQVHFTHLVHEELQELTELRSKCNAQKELIAKLELQLKQDLAQYQTGRLLTEFKKHIEASSLPIQCPKLFYVSNFHYWSHRDLLGNQALAYLNLSGIVQLRRHVISLGASERLRAAERYIRDEVPQLLAEVELELETGRGKPHRHVVLARLWEAVDEFETILLRRLGRSSWSSALSGFKLVSTLMEKFDEFIVKNGNISGWGFEAGEAASEWVTTLDEGKIAAACRDFGGVESIRGPSSSSWNTEAMRAVGEDLGEGWERLMEDLERVMKDLKKIVAEDFTDGLKFAALQRLAIDQPAAFSLKKAIEGRRQLLLLALDDLYKRFKRRLSLLRTDALTGIRTSIFGQWMERYYAQCNLEYGPEGHANRVKILQAALGNQEVYRHLMKEFKKRFAALVSKFDSKVQEVVESHLEGVVQMLDFVRDRSPVVGKQADEGKFRNELRELVGKVVKEMEGIKGGSRDVNEGKLMSEVKAIVAKVMEEKEGIKGLWGGNVKMEGG